MEKKRFIYIVLAMFVWGILGTVFAAYYFVQYDIYQKEYNNLTEQFNNISLKANILLDYGNETKRWYNNTVLPLGATAFNATHTIAHTMNYIDYEELGIYVTSINGLAFNSSHGWVYWTWDSEGSQWALPKYSCSEHILHDGDTIAFAYSKGWPPPPPS